MKCACIGLVAVQLLGCHDSEETGSDDEPATPVDRRSCDAPPIAWVLAPDVDATSAWLAHAGFDVRHLPLDRSAFGLDGIIVIGSGASAMLEYGEYMQAFSDGLYYFVDDTNVLVQLDQDPEVEATPPFLPTTHDAKRGAAEPGSLTVLRADHPLLEGLVHDGEPIAWREGLGTEAFAEQAGFEVLLAGSGDGRDGALLEGAYGQGRILLSSLALDAAPGAVPDRDAFAAGFARNLRSHRESVCLREGASVKPTPPPEPVQFTAGSSVLVALPDTQVYSLRMPGVFDSQTSWIARNASDLDIRYVFTLGDIVNNNSDLEWQRAHAAFSLLDGIVPYALVPGNHDYGPSGVASTRDTGLNEWFDYDALAAVQGFGGSFEPGKLDNTFHLFEAAGREWIAIGLEWAPRDEVVEWANGVMADHPARLGILLTHAYLNNDDRRYDHTDTEHSQDFNPYHYDTPGEINDGEELWQKLVRRHRFVMTLNGHVLGDGSGYLASTTDLGNTCHQMLSNYQMNEMGGGGYLRIIEILPDGKTVSVRSYSPLLDRYLMGADQQVAFELDAD
jgi:calcineurin-like phosphoesterase family protein